MEVFLSWSGQTSREVALALHDWLPYFIQIVRPFMSAEDIEKGSYWGEALKRELRLPYGIICLTMGNCRQPWINFEAGAISKAIGDKTKVLPFLFRVNPADIRGPLAQFQSTKYDETGEDFFRLLQALNEALEPARQVPHDVLREGFETWWPKLKARLDKIADVPPPREFPWLYTTCNLVERLESVRPDAETDCIWVATPDVFRHVREDADLMSAIEKGVGGGMSYLFFIPDNDEAERAKDSLYRFDPSKSGKVEVKPIEKTMFSSLDVTDCFILNPHGKTQLFIELPVDSGPNYWIVANERAVEGFVARFKKLKSDEEKADARRRGRAPGKTRSRKDKPGKTRGLK